jgi:hypothetical protein
MCEECRAMPTARAVRVDRPVNSHQRHHNALATTKRSEQLAPLVAHCQWQWYVVIEGVQAPEGQRTRRCTGGGAAQRRERASRMGISDSANAASTREWFMGLDSACADSHNALYTYEGRRAHTHCAEHTNLLH